MSTVHTRMTQTQAAAESNRCLHCYDAPCKKGCPAGVNVPQFIFRLASGDVEGAAASIRESNPLGLVCGQVCPSSTLCEASCNCKKMGGAIPIADLQAYAMEYSVRSGKGAAKTAAEKKGKKVAVIGGGPGGVVAAASLGLKGYDVTVFEKTDSLGGTPLLEIPNDRLDKGLYVEEIEQLLAGAGVTVLLETEVDAAKAAEIASEYDAVYLACGLTKATKTVDSEAEGVLNAESFLQAANGGDYENVEFPETVFVQGGGNTAIDAASTAKALGAERVYLCYRRSKDEMPAWSDEFAAAVEAGVEFMFRTQILSVKEENGKMTGVVLAPVSLGEPDESGRRRPVVEEGKAYEKSGSMLIMAAGKKADKDFVAAFDAAKAAGKLFLGGDVENGGATVVKAVAEARDAAAEIDAYLSK